LKSLKNSDKKIISEFKSFAEKEMFDLCRSITGKGIKKSLNLIKKKFKKLSIYKIKSGSIAFDWKIPPEWNIKKAYILDKNKKKIIDFKNNNLHLVNYSIPINKILKRDELLKKIYSLPAQPNAIPYVTSYYKRDWGFCCDYNTKKKLSKNYKKDDFFKVVIESSHNQKGYLNYGEIYLPGKSKQEILISTYLCHPSMANNELSGPIVSMSLIKYFMKKKLNKSLRFIFIPETIGSIAWIAKNYNHIKSNIIGGYNLSCIGDEKNYSFVESKDKKSLFIRYLVKEYKRRKIKYKKYSFLKRGSDERQFNSPGIDLPIVTVSRTKFGEYKEYHTSLDNFDLVTSKGLLGGFKIVKSTIENILKLKIPKSRLLCEPHLSKYNLYNSINFKSQKNLSMDYLNFLQYSDGTRTLEEISKIINLNYKDCEKIAFILKKNKLILI
jgi:aminopeptidase-like protein